MRSKTIVALAAASAVVLAACGGGGGAGDTAGDGPVVLDYWGWGTATPDVVAAWNAANPDVQVRHTDAGGGSDSSAKLLTAARAGDAPDVALVEYGTLPAMIVGDVAADITEHVGPVQGDFTDAVWSLTRFNGAVYGIPQDVGPMALVYHQQRFAELGISVPTTWQEFATAAEAVRAADPDAYLATFDAGEFAWLAGLSQQAGGEWWSVDGDTWTVGIADESSFAVADFWQDLIDRDLIKVEPLLTPEWNTQVNEGNILSWPSALWAPGVLHGVAESQVGQWAMAPLPQWTPGDPAVAFQGGSATVVTTSAENPEAAARFAAWINTSDEANAIAISSGKYPASTSGQDAAVASEPPVLMPQQTDFWAIAAQIAADTVPEISWGPNVNVAASAYEDAVNRALQEGRPLREALVETQRVVVEDMRTTGFTVTDQG
jgi:multiple sugar transport system substrate-binding protein